MSAKSLVNSCIGGRVLSARKVYYSPPDESSYGDVQALTKSADITTTDPYLIEFVLSFETGRVLSFGCRGDGTVGVRKASIAIKGYGEETTDVIEELTGETLLSSSFANTKIELRTTAALILIENSADDLMLEIHWNTA